MRREQQRTVDRTRSLIKRGPSRTSASSLIGHYRPAPKWCQSNKGVIRSSRNRTTSCALFAQKQRSNKFPRARIAVLFTAPKRIVATVRLLPLPPTELRPVDQSNRSTAALKLKLGSASETVMKSRSLRLLFLSVPLFCVATVIVSPAQTLTVLAAFNGFNGGLPTATVVQGTDGNFYGTTNWGEGSSNGHGNVFSVTPSGDLTIVYSFCSLPNCADGAFPAAGLVQGSDENFYGTTTEGGALNAGTLFKVTPSGTFTTLHSFCSFQNCADGGSPYGTLVQGSDGDFYGTTNTGGINEGGTIFKITPGGTLTTNYSFCSLAGCADGAATYSGLVQGEDGNFYGTTYGGGYRSLYGTVFKVTSTGTLTTLYEFCTQPNCADGDFPLAALVQGTDGNFYGTTSEGGNQNCGGYGCGTVFKITPSGTLTTIYDLCSQANCADGANPWALVQATDGSFYGTTRTGGAQNDGVVFQVASGGDLMSAYSVCSQDDCVGGQPMAGVIQGTDGNFYGTIYSGGSGGYGSVFRLSVGIALSPVQFVPVAPCRLVDTRQTHQPIQSGTFAVLQYP